MTTIRAKVNPDLLVWARKSAGYTLAQAAHKLGVSEERLSQWEAGEAQPTIKQLRNAVRVYKRPLALFFLHEPPQDFMPMHDFRRISGEDLSEYSPELRFAIRHAQERRESLLDLIDESGEEPLLFDLNASSEDDPEEVAGKIRSSIGITYQEQVTWRDQRIGFNNWRERIEQLGVLVFQVGGIELSEMRGFSIADRTLPVIVVNNKDAPSGRTFSLLHEFVHLMIGDGGICDMQEGVLRPPEEDVVEVFCNAVAGAALVPQAMLLSELVVSNTPEQFTQWSTDQLSELARQYCVSKEVILRRLLTAGRTTVPHYQSMRELFIEEYRQLRERERRRGGGGPHPAVMAVSSNGSGYVRAVLENYYQRRITLSQVSDYLGVKLKHLPRIEASVFGR
ncbi:MAG: ImmA/IrrE family metallo-endopeptidase [Sedimenticola sp.]